MTARRFSPPEIAAAARLQASIDIRLGRDSAPPLNNETFVAGVPASHRPVSPNLRAAAARLHRKISRRLNRDPVPSPWIGILRPPIVLTVLATLLLVAMKVNPVVALAAVLPVSSLVGVLRWTDRWRPKTESQFWRFCGRGAGAGFVVLLVMGVTGARQGSGRNLELVLGEPVLAESLKGIVVILTVVRIGDELDRMLDWIVYGGFVAAGFVFVENFSSFGARYGGASTGEVTAFMLRGVLAPSVSLLCTCLIVVGVVLAIRTRRPLIQLGAPLLGFLGAVGLRSIWISTETLPPTAFVTMYFLVVLPVAGLTVLVVYNQHARDLGALVTELPDLVADKIVPPNEVTLLTNRRARRHWRTEARRRSGMRTARAVAQYQEAVTELAILRRSIRSGDTGPRVRARELDLMGEVARTRVEAEWLEGKVSAPAGR
ncbi:PrsW family intramembrane metalloprotease [Amycolatopsis alba]|uniref:PrsW family intramembrane metalloprotease n=1 Tax=Amycolatopsis alba DSM 44262 TaxID=1125972 RepID=A0A229S833_AMYAL|nr:PrsW family glutamic-type intramembrane protease [Amycolatopsis alba]OXM54911.1 PrsW family intramembrane metalloprotease [Amycolatopsis alba DSM 44262]